MVATKASLSIRVDALADVDTKSEPMAPTIGIENRAKLESRLRALEYRSDLSGVRNADPNAARKQQPKFQMTGETKTYNTAADAVGLSHADPQAAAVQAVLDVKEERKKRKEEKKAAKEERKKEKQKVVERAHAAEDAMDEDGKENGAVEETKEERKARKAARRAAKKAAAEGETAPPTVAESVDSQAVSGSAVASITSGDDSSKGKKKRPRDADSPDKKLKKKKTV